VSRREGHDASAFYKRFPVPKISEEDEVSAPTCVDKLWVGDARKMDLSGEIADNSVALVVTSPPYFVGKEYEEAVGQGHIPADYVDFLAMLEEVFAECMRKLEPGGRIAVNVANLGRRPYRSLSADVTSILQDRLGLLLRGEVIWHKAKGAGGNCAWGSFKSPGNPVIRDLTERVVIASKGRFDRAFTAAERASRGLPSEGSISVDEFMEATTDVWEIAAESASRVGHPAPFPVELPERLINLYTYPGDLVLDPFMGAGTTAVAALRTGRHFVGFDTDSDYVAEAEQRIAEERLRIQDEGRDRDTSGVLGDSGDKARDLARSALDSEGFRVIRERVRLPCAVEVDFEAVDHSGEPWLFDVAGAFSITQRPGLRRSETLWKALGKAAVLHADEQSPPLVLLTTDLPAPNSPGHRALKAATGAGKPVHDVIEMQDPGDLARLADLARGQA
jgi:site-specific DNA-methyltransferase (adenine-specific)